MNRTPPPSGPKEKPQTREERLKAALKANIARRKAQARMRDTADDNGAADAAENKEE